MSVDMIGCRFLTGGRCDVHQFNSYLTQHFASIKGIIEYWKMVALLRYSYETYEIYSAANV